MRSTITRMPRRCASSSRRRKSSVVPYDGGDAAKVGHIVAVIPERRGIEGKQPETIDAKPLQIIQLLNQSGKITDAIVVAVIKCADMELIKYSVFVPERILIEHRLDFAESPVRNSSQAVMSLDRSRSRLPWYGLIARIRSANFSKAKSERIHVEKSFSSRRKRKWASNI